MELLKKLLGPIRVEKLTSDGNWLGWQPVPKAAEAAYAFAENAVEAESLEVGESSSLCDWVFPNQICEHWFLRGVTPGGTSLLLTLPTGRGDQEEFGDDGDVSCVTVSTSIASFSAVFGPQGSSTEAISYAEALGLPRYEVELATTTGSVVVAVRNLSEHEELRKILETAAEERPSAKPTRTLVAGGDLTATTSVLAFTVEVRAGCADATERLQRCIGGRQEYETYTCHDGSAVAGITGNGRRITVKTLNSGGAILEFKSPGDGSLQFASEVLRRLAREGFGFADADCLLLTEEGAVAVRSTVWSLYDQTVIAREKRAMKPRPAGRGRQPRPVEVEGGNRGKVDPLIDAPPDGEEEEDY